MQHWYLKASGKVVPVVQAFYYSKYLGHLELRLDADGELQLPVQGSGVKVPKMYMIFFNGPTPASFLFIFGIFKQTIQFFTTNQCEKMKCPSMHRDLNPRPLEYESSPITTRTGLPHAHDFSSWDLASPQGDHILMRS